MSHLLLKLMVSFQVLDFLSVLNPPVKLSVSIWKACVVHSQIVIKIIIIRIKTGEPFWIKPFFFGKRLKYDTSKFDRNLSSTQISARDRSKENIPKGFRNSLEF